MKTKRRKGRRRMKKRMKMGNKKKVFRHGDTQVGRGFVPLLATFSLPCPSTYLILGEDPVGLQRILPVHEDLVFKGRGSQGAARDRARH